ncbi:MAG: putative colanic acid biosysnthesis UDP-glucose lipid carrier transferase [Hyphomicrobiales bacterium]|nr:putative colanic acid biosysnthesis UDP-glucose lipid carrier transferase [Hyphomicrobiales bacterium]
MSSLANEFERPEERSDAKFDHFELPWFFRCLDVALVVAVCVCLSALHRALLQSRPMDPTSYGLLGLLIGLIFVGLNELRGLYRYELVFNAPKQVRGVVLDWMLVWSFLAFAAFALKSGADFSRIVLAEIALLALAAVIGGRMWGRRWFSGALAFGVIARDRIAILRLGPIEGCGQDASQRFSVVHAVSVCPDADASAFETALRGFTQSVHEKKVRKIIVVAPFMALRRLEEINSALRHVSVPSLIVTDAWATRLFARPVALDDSTLAFENHASPLTLAQRVMKRGLDTLLAGTGVMMLLPLLAALALAVKLSGPGPVIFRQRRLGFNGREFHIFKFRSMKVQEDGDVIRQAQRSDSRVTRVGRFIRATSLDELPQLFNVLRGEMSLVGPRPHAVAHDNHYDGLISDYSMRRHMKPGLTGWAQIHGLRGETPTVEYMASRVEHDLWYIENWTLWLDCWILLRTLGELFRKQDAF